MRCRRPLLALCLAVAGLGASARAATPPDRAIARAKAAMMASPADALSQARAAEAMARALPPGPAAGMAIAQAQWLEGEANARLNEPRAALPLLEQALAAVVRLAPADPLHGNILLSRGWAEGMLGQVQPALRDFLAAHDLFRAAGDTRGQAKALQNVGGIYHDAGDDQRSLRYYAQVAELDAKDPAIALAGHNNVGETLKALGRYREARVEYGKALVAARRLGGPLLQIRILTNLASAELLDNDPAQASITAHRALALAADNEMADERPFAWGVLAQIAARRGDYPAAATLIDRTFAGVDLAHTALPYRDFHETAAHIFDRLGDPARAYVHLMAYKRIDDGVRALASSTNAALMAARFDFTNQNMRIFQLNADRLRREASYARARARLTMIIVALGGTAVAIVFVLLLANARAQRRSRDRVRTANDQLSDSNRSLEKALKAKTEFLATTSHEIRTPLNGILGMTQVILADTRVERDLRDRIEVVHGAGETMRALVDDILDIAKMETGQLNIVTAPLDLRTLCADAGRFWQGQAEAKGLAVRLDLAGCPGLIAGDEARLRQIVFNIMSNALKFTGEGHVSLAVDTAALADGEELRIAISDSGIGIPTDQLELIFEKFHQVEGGTNRRYSGTGLGLAICRTLAQVMGGTIDVASRPGEGTTFVIRLPLCRLADPAVEAPADTAPEGTSLLLIEPNALTQRVLAKSLKPALASFETVADAAGARARLHACRFDHLLVQADAIMSPDVPPAAALAELSHAARAAGARITIMFTPGGTIDAAALLAAGADAALAKPLGATALLAALALPAPARLAA